MKTNHTIPQDTITIISKLVGLTPDQCQEALEKYMQHDNHDEIIPCAEVQRITGWSRSTLKRRLKELGIQTCLVPGWRAKPGLSRNEFELKSRLNLDNINQLPNKKA